MRQRETVQLAAIQECCGLAQRAINEYYAKQNSYGA